jgi:preprotein translocase subunit SecG
MLYGFLVTLFVILCFLLMAIILIQKSKGSLGIGNSGGGMQMLFGGSGGQNLFQKITWFMGALFMLSSLLLALYKSQQFQTGFLDRLASSTAQSVPAQESPAPAQAPQQQ